MADACKHCSTLLQSPLDPIAHFQKRRCCLTNLRRPPWPEIFSDGMTFTKPFRCIRQPLYRSDLIGAETGSRSSAIQPKLQPSKEGRYECWTRRPAFAEQKPATRVLQGEFEFQGRQNHPACQSRKVYQSVPASCLLNAVSSIEKNGLGLGAGKSSSGRILIPNLKRSRAIRVAVSNSVSCG